MLTPAARRLLRLVAAAAGDPRGRGAARLRRIPLVVDVRDVWPAAAEALGELSDRGSSRCFGRAERRLYRQAHRVTTTTRPFCAHIDGSRGAPRASTCPTARSTSSSPCRTAARTVAAVPRRLRRQLRDRAGARHRARRRRAPARRGVRFVLVGDGALGRELQAAIRPAALRDLVELRPPVPVAEVGGFLRSCDALLIPLRDHALLGDFIPSKLYDAMAVGRPALVAAARGGGRARRADRLRARRRARGRRRPGGRGARRWRRRRAGRPAGRGRASGGRRSWRARARSTRSRRVLDGRGTGMRRLMCGIVGVVRATAHASTSSRSSRCATRCAHRGPDDEGVWRAATARRRSAIAGWRSSTSAPPGARR